MNTWKSVRYLLGILTVLLAGCGNGPSLETAALPTGEWTDHGYTAEQKSEVKGVMEEAVASGEMAGGSLLLIHRGEVIFKEAVGFADIQEKRPFGVDDVCALASVTKPYTATLLVMLEEEGVLSLDDPVDRYLPEFRGVRVRSKGPVENMPTIRQALSHTAGFGSGNDFRAEMLPIVREGTLAEMVGFLAGKELIYEPGTRYFYTSMGYFVAGRVAEVASGREFSELLRERLLEPVAASSTRYNPSDELLDRVPRSYTRRRSGEFEPQGSRFRGTCIRPGGGLFATLEDVGRFMMLHRNGGIVLQHRIVSPESLGRMYRSQPETEHGYGLGFNVLKKDAEGRGTRIMHLGAAGTMAWLDFDLDLIVILFTQMPLRQIQEYRERTLRTVLNIFEEVP